MSKSLVQTNLGQNLVLIHVIINSIEEMLCSTLQLEELLKLSSRFVRRLIVRQLLPPPHDQLLADDDEGDG